MSESKYMTCGTNQVPRARQTTLFLPNFCHNSSFWSCRTSIDLWCTVGEIGNQVHILCGSCILLGMYTIRKLHPRRATVTVLIFNLVKGKCKDRVDRTNCSMLGLCVVLRYRFVFTMCTSYFQCSNSEHALATRCLVHDLFHHSHIHHLNRPILYPSPSPSPLRLPDTASGLLNSATEDCQLSAACTDCSTHGECQWFV